MAFKIIDTMIKLYHKMYNLLKKIPSQKLMF